MAGTYYARFVTTCWALGPALGNVPGAPGLYAFAVADKDRLLSSRSSLRP